MSEKVPTWICCQLGAREHYAVPRALHRAGELASLITDVWVAPNSPVAYLFPPRLRERFHYELTDISVKRANLSAVLFEAQQSAIGTKGWDLIVRRNDWFQAQALQWLVQIARRNPAQKFRLFAFSYTARRLFEFAKSKGWKTFLGQIDPGPPEERILAGLHKQKPVDEPSWHPAPGDYWRAWREECRLADCVIVNSSWSRQALMEEGVPERKLSTVPLGYESPIERNSFRRRYPERFTHERPLRVLFLGQVNVRKGTAMILDAIRLLQNEPVEFWFVGPIQMELPRELSANRQTRWLGSVPRGLTHRFYQEADVFLFPTFSDGFGLTQLEAQAWKLPIMASRFCGDVVRDGVNGVLLEEVSGRAIAGTIASFVANPNRLAYMSQHAVMPPDFGLDQLGTHLLRSATS